MKKGLRVVITVLLFIMLTLLTQVGGVVYLLYKVVLFRFGGRLTSGFRGLVLKVTCFTVLYVVVCLVAVPPLARMYGRVPLPYFSTDAMPLRPANILTCLAQRHYVRPKMKELIRTVSRQAQSTIEADISLLYLDANFPFWDGFPLLPHRSHDDGKKLDIAFLYQDKHTKKLHHRRLSFWGYGVCEPPLPGETDMPAQCTRRGYWWYNILYKMTSQRARKKHTFDSINNKKLLQLIANHPLTGKIFIEPHLKTRLGLHGHTNIRFHGCAAVRHDDHIHIQL